MDSEQALCNRRTNRAEAEEAAAGEWLDLAVLEAGTERLGAMLGRSEHMAELFKTIARIGPHKSTVLIEGESGTGKELVAHALHMLGPAPKGPFVIFNCSNLVDTLAESQLFGHVRGAFTDARETSLGYFRSANGGSLFLDEIGELPLRLQSKLLRVVESLEIQPVGSAQSYRVDVRLIAATNRDLRAMVKAGRFRDDLYYRLNTSLITIAPLRQRRRDLQALAAHFIARYNRTLGKNVAYLSRRALNALLRHEWPGNVRELSHTIEGAMLLTDGDRIDIGNLPAHMMGTPAMETAELIEAETCLEGGESADDDAPWLAAARAEAAPLSLDYAIKQAARVTLVRALDKSEGNCIRAARLLGVSRYTVYRMISRFGLAETRSSSSRQAR
ncbi:MAG: sigma-54 dependent transcriptional regulator [Candidatus Binataceae bacterium]